ncbi:MAG: protein-glutamine glutaminase family protein [Promethearchaeota archaeon]
MSNPNEFIFLKLIDEIRSFSPSRETFVGRPTEELPETVTVNFNGGRSGILDMKNPRAVHWANVIDRLKRANRPVYVEIDQETNIITNLLIPRIQKVRSLSTDERGNIIVKTIPSAAIHYLLRNTPNFEEMRNTLQSALNENLEVLMTETIVEHEIIDVKKSPRSPQESSDPAPAPAPDPSVSEPRAQELFDDMNNLSCNPCAPSSSCIPFKYPDDGCACRAHKMCYLMNEEGETPGKVWLYGDLTVKTPNNPFCKVRWSYHVAPTLTVTTSDGDVKRVIDPSLSDRLMSVEEWRGIQGSEASTTLEYTDWTVFITETLDPTSGDWHDPNCIITDACLEDYRDMLEWVCQEYGAPPYSCIKNCFFIVDRNTFSIQEIEAMLQQISPAVIETAFYVIVDGFTPNELGITSATMTATPNINITPSVSGMSVEAISLVFEDPSRLFRPQRLTWVYNIKFTDTSGFPTESPELLRVTLTASINTVSSSVYIYLIGQPNPFEIDGETSWLSTDLRVFQIKEGESKFGVIMGTNPSDFIKQVITNLNTGNTGGQTFENDISTDQQTSRLELSEKVDGIFVYNFAVGKVHYRAMEVPAQDVRVFFRLIAYTTTSLLYDQATTYRTGGQAGVVIPLLGIHDGDVVSIPCFADDRIDSSTTNMNAQPDPTNVQTIPFDATGNETVRYYGCWLDLNQTKPQFPDRPSPPDGPFTTSRKPIQEFIRNKHQCLVSEISFDPTPIPNGASPSNSDKLAQRNLSIVESANPGIDFSHRIPQTFEIRPTPYKLVCDELLIDCREIPAGSVATLYIPGINTNDILQMAAKMYKLHKLVRITEDTLKFEAKGIIYVPIPLSSGNYPGMITVDLPKGIEEGQVFTIVIRQVTSKEASWSPVSELALKWRSIIASFQITIPVRKKEALLKAEENLLSNLRWIQRAIPSGNRWFSVFRKYVEQIATRVNGFGGDSSKVVASPSNNWRNKYRKCVFLAIVSVVLLGIIVVGIGILDGGMLVIVELPLFILLIGVYFYWNRYCKPEICRLLRSFIAGLGLGAIILIILVLVGISTLQLITTLVISIVITGIAIIVAWKKRCF